MQAMVIILMEKAIVALLKELVSALSIAFQRSNELLRSHLMRVVGVSDMLSHGLRTRQFLEHQGYILQLTIVHQDNMSAIKSINKGNGTESSKHIRIREFWTSDQVNLGEITLDYLKSEGMLADVLTKPITGERFIKLRNKILNWHN